MGGAFISPVPVTGASAGETLLPCRCVGSSMVTHVPEWWETEFVDGHSLLWLLPFSSLQVVLLCFHAYQSISPVYNSATPKGALYMSYGLFL